MTSLDQDPRVVRNLARIDRLVKAFHTASEPGPQRREPLFLWRHLEVEGKLAEGSFGQVYRAWDPALQRAVALKLVPSDARSEARHRLMIAEARRLARARHPNVLAVHGADTFDDRTGIWTDLLEGRTLQDRIEHAGPLAGDSLVALAIPLADALATLHAKSIVHGDIKPANIMIEPNGSPVLVDFGAVHGKVEEGTRYGSPLTMAPEQFAGSPPTPASDLYAFGVVLYYALTGDYPFTGQSFDTLGAEKASQVGDMRKRVPHVWRKLVRRLLDADPEKRGDPRELATTLHRIRTAKTRRRRKTAVASVIGALSVATVFSLVAYRAADQSRLRVEQMKNVIVESAEASLPEQQQSGAALVTLYEELAERIETRLKNSPSALAEMRIVAARGLSEFGRHRRALAIAEAGVELLDASSPRAHSKLATAWITVASLRKEIGDLAGAERAVDSALSHLDRTTSPATLSSRISAYGQLGNLRGRWGDWRGYVQAHKNVLAQRTELYGPEAIETAVDHHNLSVGYHAVGEYALALEHGDRARDLLTQAEAEESLRMGIVESGRANALINLNRFSEAQAALDAARKLQDRSLPSSHSRVRNLALIQGRLWLHAGDYDAAEATLRALANESDANETLRSAAHISLADLLAESSRWRAAADAYAAALEVLAPKHAHKRDFCGAAAAFARYRSDPTTAPPSALMRSTMDGLRSAGYGTTVEYRRLQRWCGQLGRSTAPDCS